MADNPPQSVEKTMDPPTDKPPQPKTVRPLALFPDDTTPPTFSNSTGAVPVGSAILVQFGYYDVNEVGNKLAQNPLPIIPEEGFPVTVRSIARFAITREQAELLVQQLVIAIDQADLSLKRTLEKDA